MRPAAAVVAASLILGACSSARRRASVPRSMATTTTMHTAPSTSAVVPSTTVSCPDRVLAGLSPAQRVGQLFMVGVPMSLPSQSALDALVAVHAGGAVLWGNTTAGAAAVKALTDRIKTAAAAATPGVGLYVATDQEGGEIQELKGAGFPAIPTAQEQGQLKPAVLQAQARSWAAPLAEAGVNVDLAPVVDVVPVANEATNLPIAHFRRQLGSDPAAVAAHGAAIVGGLQAGGVAATLKHFPGLGRVVGNTDTAAHVVDTVTTRHDGSLRPFAAGIAAGARFVMISLATYQQIDPEHLAVFSATVITGMIRSDLGFRGLVLSDDLGSAAQVATVPPPARALDFLRAGGDIAVVVKPPSVVVSMAAALVAGAETDPAVRQLVDDRARAVLQAKLAAGLLTCGNS